MGGKSSSQTIGYRYIAGIHQVLCHGPIDYIIRLTVDEREAWKGANDGSVHIDVDAPELFGGDEREGGVSGRIDVDMGGPAQLANEYLEAQLGDVPAYRGVVSLVYRDFYWGNNPYLKPARARGSRIHVRQDGLEQWYDEKAEVNACCESEESETIIRIEYRGLPSENSVLGHTVTAPGVGGGTGGTSLFINDSSIVNDNSDNIPLGDLETTTHEIFNVRYPSLRTDYYWRGSKAPLAEQEARWLIQYGAFDFDPGTVFWRPSILQPGMDDFQVLFTKPVSQVVNPGDTSDDVSDAAGWIQNRNLWPDWNYFDIPGPQGLDIQDMNFAHMIRECLTDPDWGMGYAESDIDDTSFTGAADTLFDECFGGSIIWDREIPIEEFVNELIKHIDGALYVSRTTGKFVLKLIRDDYDPNNLLLLDESNIVSISKPTRPAFGELTNSVTVQFWNRATGKNDSVTENDPALNQMQGVPINTTIEYKALTKPCIASKVARRDLRSLSQPLLSCTIYANTDGRELNIGDVFEFAWSRWGITSMVMRITGIAIGDGKNNQVRIDCIQDVFDTPDTGIVQTTPTQWTNPQQPPQPVPIENQLADEAPYWELVQVLGQSTLDSKLAEDNTIGYVFGVSTRSQFAVNARIWTDSGSGYINQGPLDFCPYGTLVGNLDKVATSFSIQDFVALGSVNVGDHLQIGDELMRIDSIDTATGALTVGRGILDTVPHEHSADDLVLFWDLFYGVDLTEYVGSETVDVKIQPKSGSGSVNLADITAISVTLDQRAFRPYPPGYLRVNSEYYEDNTYDGLLTISFAHRDRVQQTSGNFVDHADSGDIGPESGQVYRLRGYIDNVLVHTEDDVASSPFTWTPSDDGLIRVEVDSKRDGLYSRQAATHEFFYTSADGRATEPGNERATENGGLRLTED